NSPSPTGPNRSPPKHDTEIPHPPAYCTSTPTPFPAPQPAYGIAHNQIYVEQPGFPKRVSSQRGGGTVNCLRRFALLVFFRTSRFYDHFEVFAMFLTPSIGQSQFMIHFLYDCMV